MLKNILVPVPAAEQEELVFRCAAFLARLHSAHIAFLYVRPDMRRLVEPMISAEFGGSAGIIQLIETLEHESIANHDRARSAMYSFCQREDLAISPVPLDGRPTAEWRVETGEDAEWLAVHGRVADLVLVGRAQAREAGSLQLLEAALMQTGRPLLLLPPNMPDRIGNTLAIAWKDTPEAATAITAALPFLMGAKKIVILGVIEDESVDSAACERLRGALVWHNPAVTVQTLTSGPDTPAGTLLKAAGELGADLLVMGGYGHSRMREMVFGGFTRHVLRETELPVLMAH
ncbi:MAG TPA: universal stress protein [Acidobacteriaceae bacterium]|jgi:nucleotide-binding universal stress UspA family protein|nr:universal stress protein [Acidobacteriaceae bacterium]